MTSALPLLQVMHVDALAEEYVEPVQVTHSSDASSSAYLPATQSVHEVNGEVDVVPLRHASHEVAPVWVEYRPAVHVSHSEPVDFVPAAQKVQFEAPSPETLPLSQVRHVSEPDVLV